MDRTNADAVLKRFHARFHTERREQAGRTGMLPGCVGTIEGGDGTPVQLYMLTGSWDRLMDAATCARYGCPTEGMLLLVEWLPAGMTYTDDAAPRDNGVDPDHIPDPTTWETFPRSFEDLPVHYARGTLAFAAEAG